MLTRIIARIAVVVSVLAASVATLSSPAQAQNVTCSPDGLGGQICFVVLVVQTPGGWTVEVSHHSGGETRFFCVRPSSGNYVACQDIAGWYNAESDCYIDAPDEPIPPHPDMPGYETYGDEGVVYWGMCFLGPGAVVGEHNGRPVETYPPRVGQLIVLGPGVPSGYGGTPSPLPDLLEEAINSLDLAGADIQMAPNPAGAGLVGLPVWLSTAVSESTWGPQERTAAAAGESVTATAQAEQIAWDMGDGGVEVCDVPGTPYDPSYGMRPSPDCGYPGYREPSRSQPGGRYPITATTTWTITWSSTVDGAEGELSVETGSITSVRINELQVLTTFD